MQEMMWVGHQGNSAVIFAPFVNMNCFEGLLYPKHWKKRDREKLLKKRLKQIGIGILVIKHYVLYNFFKNEDIQPS